MNAADIFVLVWQFPLQRASDNIFTSNRVSKKGVSKTTSSFSKGTRDFVEHTDPKVVLIYGSKLENYMIDFILGTTTSAVY